MRSLHLERFQPQSGVAPKERASKYFNQTLDSKYIILFEANAFKTERSCELLVPADSKTQKLLSQALMAVLAAKQL